MEFSSDVHNGGYGSTGCAQRFADLDLRDVDGRCRVGEGEVIGHEGNG